jgi:hypothetical protein
MNNLLKDGKSVTVEEQVLIFLDIVCHSNAMQQTAVKFCRRLYTVQRLVQELLMSLCMYLFLGT